MRQALAFVLVIFTGLALALPLPAAPVYSSAPTPAIKLSATLVSATEVQLTWADSLPAAAGFKIERSANGRIFIQIAAASANATNYPDTGLIPNTTYFYRVRSFSAAGDSPYSNPVQVQTSGPAAPLALVEWGNTPADPPAGLSQLVAVAAGSNHQLALKRNGAVIGWGGDLTLPTNLNNVVAIAAGGLHCLALKRDGTVVGWGHNDYLQATPPTHLSKIVGIAGGGRHSLALTAKGTVVGWGDNSFGQAQPPADLKHIVAIAAGDTHSLALTTGGTVVGWGANFWGQAQPPPQLTDVVAIAAGSAHSLALKRDGTVVGWGYSPPPPLDLTGVVAIAAGGDQSLALKSDGTVVRWGWGWGYDGIDGGMPSPALVGVTAIAVGGNAFLALSIVPAPPLRLAARISATNQVDLSWLDNSEDEDSFIIERALDSGVAQFPGQPFVGTWTQIATVGAGVTNYQDMSVATNLTYRYRVYAHNSFGNSPASRPVIINIQPPSAPYWQMTAVGATNQIDLAWSSDVAVDGFRIEWAPDAGGSPGTWSEINTPLTNTSYATFTDTNVTALTTNWYRVRGFNVLGYSPYSEAARVAVVPPPAPDYLYAFAFGDQINLAWGFPNHYGIVNGFEIERAVDVNGSPGPWNPIATLAVSNRYDTSFNYTDPQRAVNTTYWYRVRAFNWLGEGAYSAMASATIVPPAAPSYLTGQIGAIGHRVNLSWEEWPADEHGFRVERATDSGGNPGPWREIGTVLATNISHATYADTSVTALTTNWYRIRAFNELGTSPYSEAVCVGVMPPPAPYYLSAVAFRDQIGLSWYFDSRYGAVNGFKIERARDMGGHPGVWVQVASVASNSPYYNSYVDTNRTVGATYWYRVRAFNWLGNGDYSLATSATIVPPAAPIYLAGQIGSTNRINLSWQEPSADQDGFRIERASDNGGNPGTWTRISTLWLTNFFYAGYTDTNAQALTTNWYRVQAFNGLGTSAYSEATRVQVVPPPAPDYLYASVFRDQISLSWSFSYNYGAVDGFKIERAPDVSGSPGAWGQIANVASSYYNNYTDTNLTGGLTYWYRVRAFNWVGNGDYSPMASATIIPPAAPVFLTGQIGATNQVNLSWSESPADEDGFSIERAPDSGGNPGAWAEIGTLQTTNAGLASFTDTNATALTTNWYRVRAFNRLGTSAYSQDTLVLVVPPSAPCYLNANAFRDQIVLSWTGGYFFKATDRFKIERAPDVSGSPGAWVQIAEVGNSYFNYYTDTNLAGGSTYWYRVRAFNWVGDSDYSPVASATIVPPAAPVSLAGQIGATNQVNLSWYEGTADADGFSIERAPDSDGSPGTYTEIGTLLATNASYLSFTDTNVTALTTNWYRVRAFNGLGASPYSQATSVQVAPPWAPNDLSASVFRDRISLSWSFNNFYGVVDGFKIERALDVGGSPGTWAQIASVASSYFNNYTDTNRTGGLTYWYRVRAFNWVGNGDYSPVASATIVPPAAPYSLSGLIGVTNHQVNLSWSQWPADEDGFRVERATDSSGNPGSWREIGTVLATNTSYATYTDTNATAFTTNWYRIRAFNGLGTSSYSDAACVRVVPPPAPSYLSAVAFRDQIGLSWYFDASYGAGNGFKIERAPDVAGNPGAWVQIAKTGNDINNYTDAGRAVNKTYWYRLRAFNWVGNGDYSPVANATIVPPAAPASLAGQIGATNQVNLSWYESSADQNGFHIERAPDSGGSPGTWTEIGTLRATNTTFAAFTDTNVTALTTNWYRVRAFNELGTSPYSDAICVQVAPPSAPNYLSANVFRDQVSLSWSFNYFYEVADGFRIERAPDVGGSPGAWVQIATIAGSYYYNSYTDTHLTGEGTYWYRVRAFSWVGNGDYSPVTSATIVPPAAPYSLSGQIGATNHQVNLSWNEWPADEDGFRVERAPDVSGSPGTWTEIGMLLATNSSYASFTDTNVTALTTNWYRVRAFNSLGTSDYSEATRVQVVPPPAPDYLYASVFRDQISLSWSFSYNYGAVGFKIERAPDVSGGPGAWVQIANVASSYYYNNYTDTNLTGGLTYWYRVRAFNWVGNGDYSPMASATIIPPAAPVFLTGQIGATNQVNLSWYEGSADADGFSIERAPDSDGSPGTYTEIGTLLATNASSVSFTDTNVTALTTNWYRVRAFNSLGTSDYSQVASVQIVPPPAPLYLYAYTYGGRISIYWYFSYNYGAVNGSKIERAPDVSGSPGAWAEIEDMNNSYGNSYTDTNVIAGTTYWYRVRGFNWVGDGDYGQPISATLASATGAAASRAISNPAAEARITALIATNCDVLVVWQTTAGSTNVVEATSNLSEGFTNLSPALLVGGSGLIETNYLDAGARTNAVQRFYRVKLK